MAQITPANTYPGLTKKKGAAPGEPEIYRPLGMVNYFRVVPADDIQGAVGAKWAKQRGAKKVYILNDQELYGKGIADVFEAAAKKIGIQVAANEGIDWKQPDQKPVDIAAAALDWAKKHYHDVLIDPGHVNEVWSALIHRVFETEDWDSWEWEELGPDAAALSLPLRIHGQ